MAPAFSAAAPAKECFDMDSISCEIFSLTNAERLKAQLPPLHYNPTCFAMAQEQSDDMSIRHYFDHQRPEESFSQRVARFGLQSGVGENIAAARSPSQAMALWMKSPGHRRNILNPRFLGLGVGFKNGLYTQAFANQ